jgi:hypothetical protein
MQAQAELSNHGRTILRVQANHNHQIKKHTKHRQQPALANQKSHQTQKTTNKPTNHTAPRNEQLAAASTTTALLHKHARAQHTHVEPPSPSSAGARPF